MSSRFEVRARCLVAEVAAPKSSRLPRRNYATAQAIVPAASHEQMTQSAMPITRYPPSQPPSHRPPEFRRTQIHRQYTSLLRSTPMMLLYQHNNLKAMEWVAIRRELNIALRKVDEARLAAGKEGADMSSAIKILAINGGVFGAALRVVEYYRPEVARGPNHPTDPAINTSLPVPQDDPALTHGLSRAAHAAVLDKKFDHALTPLLSGPLAVMTFPEVSTDYLKAALSILSPQAPNFPAPPRRLNPGYHDATTQTGVRKLMLLGARVESKVFDMEGTRWVGTIEGGLDGLRSQLVAMLQGFGGMLTNTLESASKNLYFTVESRRAMLEEEQNGGKSETEKLAEQ